MADFGGIKIFMKIVLGILILVSAVFLIVAVLMQSGSSKRLSGSIAGAAETLGVSSEDDVQALVDEVRYGI